MEEKKAFYENLGETAQLVFLEEVPKSSRKKHLKNAEVLVSRSFSRKEISSKELDLIRSVKFVQLIFSGAASHGSFHINFPFLKFPNLIGSPHNADHVPGMMLDATQKALRNVHNYLLGEKVHSILTRKDYPPS